MYVFMLAALSALAVDRSGDDSHDRATPGVWLDSVDPESPPQSSYGKKLLYEAGDLYDAAYLTNISPVWETTLVANGLKH